MDKVELSKTNEYPIFPKYFPLKLRFVTLNLNGVVDELNLSNQK